MATITTRRGRHILNWTDPETGQRKHTPLGKVGSIPKRELDDLLRIKGIGRKALKLIRSYPRPRPE